MLTWRVFAEPVTFFLLVANKIHYKVRSYLLSNIVHVHKGTYAIVPENIFVCTSMYVCRSILYKEQPG